MHKNLKVLLVEDMENDALLILRELRKQNYEPSYKRVDTADAMQAALENDIWDIILTDHNMPSFNSSNALEIRKQKAPHLPIILVSGTIGEEATVQAVKAGIDDFVNKADLDRLVPVMERVLRETENRNRRKQAESKLRETETLHGQAKVWAEEEQKLRSTAETNLRETEKQRNDARHHADRIRTQHSQPSDLEFYYIFQKRMGRILWTFNTF